MKGLEYDLVVRVKKFELSKICIIEVLLAFRFKFDFIGFCVNRFRGFVLNAKLIYLQSSTLLVNSICFNYEPNKLTQVL